MLLLILTGTTLLSAQQAISETVSLSAQEPLHAPAVVELKGTVVDASGAVIAGATVLVRSANGSVQRTTETDKGGGFTLSGIPHGSYRVFVSLLGFQTKELPLRIGEIETPLLIALSVGGVRTSIDVQGREDDLTGIANSATQGTVGAAQLQDRPILRSGEVLETVPGLIITQHAGGGKANQYFLRGFNLDHGTDFAIFIDDMPLNLPSHAHGEGYADMNTVIPEFVNRLNFEKGPYYADVGNYGSAGSAHLEFFKVLPQNFFQVEGGMYGYGRAVFGVSQKLSRGNLLFGGEVCRRAERNKHRSEMTHMVLTKAGALPSDCMEAARMAQADLNWTGRNRPEKDQRVVCEGGPRFWLDRSREMRRFASVCAKPVG